MNVLIVDDEFYFRKALIETTDWDSFGLYVVGEAENGVDALEMVKEKKPDIILADINMPKMNGLKFAEKVKEYNKNTKIIFISGYDTFAYAKEAIRLGADGYLLKPVKDKELKEELSRVVKLCCKEKIMRKKFEGLQAEQEKNKKIKKEYFLTKALLTESEEKRKSYLKQVLAVEPSFLETGTVFFAVTGVSDNHEVMSEEEYGLWNFAGKNYFAERLSQKYATVVLPDVDNKVVFFVSVPDKEEQQEVIEILKEGQNALESYFGFSMILGISNTYEKTESFHVAYKEALKALENRIFGDMINMAEEDETKYKVNYILPENMKKKLQVYLNEQDAESADKMLNEIFEHAKEHNASWSRFRILCVELLTPCIDMLTGMAEMYAKIGAADSGNIFEEIQLKRNSEELKQYVKQIYNKMCSVSKEKTALPENVQKILYMIEERYADPELNVNSIAKEIYMNYNYLCVIFKKALNMTINDYIFKYRMQKAIEWFNHTNLQIGEVAEKVGYSNVGYFSRCFRKEFGITPSRYIESLR